MIRKSLISAYQRATKVLAGTGISRVYPLNRLERALARAVRSDQVLVDGHIMFLDADDSLRLSIFGTFEPGTTEVLKSLISPDDVAVDIGAHIGYYTLLFARWVGSGGKVFAFEPVPANFGILSKNVAVNDYENVVITQAALSNRGGSVPLYLSSKDQVDHHIYANDESRESIEVPCLRLDDALADYHGPVNLIKMDIQGAEALALEGMQTTIERSERLTLVTEFWPHAMRTCGTDPRAYLESLLDLGFILSELDNGLGNAAALHRRAGASPVDIDDLLSRCAKDNEAYADLLCVKRPG